MPLVHLEKVAEKVAEKVVAKAEVTVKTGHHAVVKAVIAIIAVVAADVAGVAAADAIVARRCSQWIFHRVDLPSSCSEFACETLGLDRRAGVFRLLVSAENLASRK